VRKRYRGRKKVRCGTCSYFDMAEGYKGCSWVRSRTKYLVGKKIVSKNTVSRVDKASAKSGGVETAGKYGVGTKSKGEKAWGGHCSFVTTPYRAGVTSKADARRERGYKIPTCIH